METMEPPTATAPLFLPWPPNRTSSRLTAETASVTTSDCQQHHHQTATSGSLLAVPCVAVAMQALRARQQEKGSSSFSSFTPGRRYAPTSHPQSHPITPSAFSQLPSRSLLHRDRCKLTRCTAIKIGSTGSCKAGGFISATCMPHALMHPASLEPPSGT